MKALKCIVIGALLNLSYFGSSAQEQRIIPPNQPNYNKPQLFADVPSKLNLKISSIEPLFALMVGSPVTVKFTKDFYLQGTVVSKAADTLVQSVIIKATNRRGAVFTFTKIKNQNGFVYRGRILSRENSDAFDIVKENGDYVLQKKRYHEIVSE